MSKNLEVKYNSCNCHPETCSCGKYVVYCRGKRICSLFNDEEKVAFLKMLVIVQYGGIDEFRSE